MLNMGTPLKFGLRSVRPTGSEQIGTLPLSLMSNIALCILTLAVDEVDEERGGAARPRGAPRELPRGGCAGADEARGIAREEGVVEDKADKASGRGCNLEGATGRPRPKAPDDAAGPARCHPQGADIRRPG